MNKPSISVILPTFNRANTVTNSIDSILNQTFNNLELIIINDASTDNTKDVIKAYQKKDSRLVLVQNRKNLGCSLSRNVGLSYAQADTIAFMDDDDQYTDNEILNCLYSQMEHECSDLVIADYKVNGDIYCMKEFSKNFKYSIINRSGPFLQSTLINKKFITKIDIPFDIKATPSEDWDFFITLSKLNPKVSYCACISFTWKLNQNSQSMNFYNEANALAYICDKHYKYMIKTIDKKIMSSHYRRIARVYEKTNSMNQICQFYKKAFIEYPFSIKNIFYRFIIMLGFRNMKPLVNWIRQIRGLSNV